MKSSLTEERRCTVDWIQWVEDSDKWRTLVDTVIFYHLRE
jgi:hypothetical protein